MGQLSLITLALARDQDVVTARARARLVAELVGFERQDQVRIGTAVSELARNAVRYAGGGTVRFAIEDAPQPALVIEIVDRGPGIADLQAVLDGSYISRTGMGIGLTGTRRLMDRFHIVSQAGRGTRVMIAKHLPRGAPTGPDIASLGKQLSETLPEDPLLEITRQNQELLSALGDLRTREDELVRLNRELEDTNRGVLALYAELDQRAADLKSAGDMKTRFFSFMSHEFRTPVNSILALSRMLIDRLDGDLTGEQAKQVGLIRRSAQGLAELVDDLLDLAKAEAGRIELRASRFTVDELFGGLKGMLRPLVPSGGEVTLAFADADHGQLETDEAKITQILRNLISNALKFTESGEIRVSARPEGSDRVVFEVSDTGIGIPAEHHEHIFGEFSQVEHHLQTKTKGTGLGLPLSRKLATLLGGALSVRSAPGTGSTFILVVPRRLGPLTAKPVDAPPRDEPAVGRRILLIDDDPVWRYVLRGLLADVPAQFFEAENGTEGLDMARVVRPDLIFLDLAMPVLDGFQTYAALRDDPALATIPVIICSSRMLADHELVRLAGVVTTLDKTTRTRDQDLARIDTALALTGLDGLKRQGRL